MNAGQDLGIALLSLLALGYAYYRITQSKRLKEAQHLAAKQKEELVQIIEEHKRKSGKPE